MKYLVFDTDFRGKCNREDTDQKRIIDWVSKNHPERFPLFYSVSNENARHKTQYGTKAGVPDLCDMNITNGRIGFFELKRLDRTKSRISIEQKSMLERLAAQGHFACVCYGFEGFKAAYKEFLYTQEK